MPQVALGAAVRGPGLEVVHLAGGGVGGEGSWLGAVWEGARRGSRVQPRQRSRPKAGRQMPPGSLPC